MTLNSVFPPCFFNPRCERVLLVTCVLLMAQGCSPTDAGAAATSVKSAVTIVRDSKPEFPDKAIAAYRELQQRCFKSRAEVAKAQGFSYDRQADQMTDAAILALDRQKTEEYFDGKKYAFIVTGTRYDGTRFGVTPELSCKLVSTPFKSADIRDGDCHRISVEYDLPETTGRRSELKGICDKRSAAIVDQTGPTVAVAGNQQCRWNRDDASPLHVATCTLLPMPVHAGTGLELIAIRKSTETLRNAGQALPGTEALSMQSLVTIEQATTIDIGSPIPAAKFEVPADSAAFPLSQVN